MPSWRLIHTPPLEPCYVMAIDEALWRGIERGGEACVCIHHFESECLTLGFSQPARDVELAGLAHLPWTRRITGGGAIHHRSGVLSFSLIGLDPPRGRRPGPIACAMGKMLADLCARLGNPAHVLSSSTDATLRAPLCADRRYAGDVVAGEAKLAGIGQRQRRNALLVQAALMGLETDERAADALAESLRACLDISLEPWTLPPSALADAERLVGVRYGGHRWKHAR